MKILMVTPYPPIRDGIAAYAVQSVARLRADGHDVEVLSPGPSAAHHHLALVGPRGALALAKRARQYDKVIIQFHPDVFFPVPASPAQWATESLALFAAFSVAHQVEVWVHEIDYSRGSGRLPYRFVNRLPWQAATSIVVHTEMERQSLVEAYNVAPDHVRVSEHGADFRRNTRLGRAAARASLGLPADDLVFLNIGFIQPHKGFDRSVRAIAEIASGPGAGRCRLDIVGSVRTADSGYLAYFDELADRAAATPGVHLHEGYVSDELFDRWLVACDVVVLPYRAIWSSGVMERALLYDRPVIATSVGGISHQRGERGGVTLVDDDQGLVQAMTEVVLARAGSDAVAVPSPPASWVGAVELDRAQIQDEIRRRAALKRHRPAGAGASATAGRTRGLTRELSTASAPIRNVTPLVLPVPGSKWPGVRAVKGLLRRLIAWEIEPLVHQVNALREAMIDAVER